jgi:hypothetical protein
MHHHPQNQERALNLSILLVSGTELPGLAAPVSPQQLVERTADAARPCPAS